MEDKTRVDLENVRVSSSPQPNTSDAKAKSGSAFKLSDATDDDVPTYFAVLINNTIAERWKLLESETVDLSRLPLDCDLLCCVSLVIAIEEGFRLDDSCLTTGFDVRALRAVETMPPTFRFIQVRVADQKAAKFCELKELSSIIRPIIEKVMSDSMFDHGVAPAASMIGLPEEVMKHLVKFMAPKDFLALTATNSTLCSLLAHNDEVWRHYLKRDMKDGIIGLNPLQAYKSWYRRSGHGQEGVRFNLANQSTSTGSGPNTRPPVRSISEVSATSTPASQRSHPRSTNSDSDF